jgi:hypothetical protein
MTEEDKTDKSRKEQKPVPDLKPKKDVKGGGKKPMPVVTPPSVPPLN